MSHTEEELRAAGFKPPVEAEQTEEQERTKRELERRLHGLSRAVIHEGVPTIDGTKALRVSIDACIKQAKALAESVNRGPGGRETALAITKLQEAKMWCGKVLEELGHKLPEEYRDEA